MKPIFARMLIGITLLALTMFSFTPALAISGQSLPVLPPQSPNDNRSQRPLAVGPSINWNTFLGGSNTDASIAITVDANENIYVVGGSWSGWGSPIRSYIGNYETFVAKLSPSGLLLWHTFLGGNGSDIPVNITLDQGSGDIYVTGFSDDTWGNPIQAYDGGSSDAFVAKLNPSGALLWNTFLGSSSVGYSIVADASGNAYVTGLSSATWGSPLEAYHGDNDAFLVKLDGVSGTSLWNTFLGSSGSDGGFSIALDSNNDLYVSGFSNITWGSPVQPYSAAIDGFVAKLTSSGTLIWNTFLGGIGNDLSRAITTDMSGNIYIAGKGNATWGNPLLAYSADDDAFAAKLDGTSGALLWNTFLGGSAKDESHSLAVDYLSGNIYLAGVSNATWGNPELPYAGEYNDVFLGKLDPLGTLLWSTFPGSRDGLVDGASIALDDNGNIYLAGNSTDTWGNPVRDFSGGSADGFAAMFLINPILSTATPTVTPTFTLTPTVTLVPSCTGTDACKDSTATIGAGSCNNGQNGQLVCFNTSGSIGDGSCNGGYQSCALHTTGSIGNNSCNGTFSCTFTTINIGNNSCNGPSACFNETITNVGDCMYNTVQVVGCPTFTPTITMTATETTTPTLTAILTETATPTLTVVIVTETPTPTATSTVTKTKTATYTKTKTASPTKTSTKTLTPTKTPATVKLSSIAAQDGWVLESGENTNIGGTLNSAATNFSLGDDAAKRQYRGVLSFNTGASLPDNATVTGVILKVKQQGILGAGNPVSIFQGFLIDIKNGFFASANTLQISDFQAVASITLGPASPAPVGSVYNFNLVTGKAFINKLATNGGLTQIRLRFKLDDNNDAVANGLNLYSGNAANAADRPQLVITYTVP